MSWKKSIRLDGGSERVAFGFMALNKGTHYPLSLGLNSVRFKQGLVQIMRSFVSPQQRVECRDCTDVRTVPFFKKIIDKSA